MNQLVGWFGSLCPSLRSSSGDLLGDLVARDGVLLLEIASKLCGRPVIPKATPQAFKTVANINAFLDTCVALGISRDKLFDAADLVGSKRNDARVLCGLKEVMSAMRARVTSAVKQIEKKPKNASAPISKSAPPPSSAPKIATSSNIYVSTKASDAKITNAPKIVQTPMLKNTSAPMTKSVVAPVSSVPVSKSVPVSAPVSSVPVSKSVPVSAPVSVPVSKSVTTVSSASASKLPAQAPISKNVPAQNSKVTHQVVEREVELSPIKREYVLERIVSPKPPAENQSPQKTKSPRMRKVTAIAQLPTVKHRGPLDSRCDNNLETALNSLLSESRYRPLKSRIQMSGSGTVSVEGSPVNLSVREGDLYIKRGSGLQLFRTWLDRRYFVLPDKQQQQQQQQQQLQKEEFDETEHLRSLLAKNTLFL